MYTIKTLFTEFLEENQFNNRAAAHYYTNWYNNHASNTRTIPQPFS